MLNITCMTLRSTAATAPKETCATGQSVNRVQHPTQLVIGHLRDKTAYRTSVGSNSMKMN